ncbi:MAG: hemerythrin family protein [Magnetococcales bacterium]|nr:hemerythrin family protein [Magnetococcales bacterium]
MEDGKQYIRWNQQWSVGVDSLDDDHKKLIGIINQIIGLYASKSEERHLRSAISKLMKYTGTHLKNEEQFLESIGYPQIQQHKEVHLRLMYDVLAAKAKLLNSHYDGTSTEELKRFLVDKWLVEHIQQGDQDYARFLRENSLKHAL